MYAGLDNKTISFQRHEGNTIFRRLECVKRGKVIAKNTQQLGRDI